ncbi:hypothetical protein [Xanthomonas phage BUDD]|nr:hypothetical protein [Xanthomonas phage BUDD]
MSRCSCKTTTRDMTYSEFVSWAHEYVTERFLVGGLKAMRDAMEIVVQQQSMNHSFNKGSFPKADK